MSRRALALEIDPDLHDRAMALAEALRISPSGLVEAMIRAEVRAVSHREAPPEIRDRYEGALTRVREGRYPGRPPLTTGSGRRSRNPRRDAEIQRARSAGVPRRALAERYGVSESRIDQIAPAPEGAP